MATVSSSGISPHECSIEDFLKVFNEEPALQELEYSKSEDGMYTILLDGGLYAFSAMEFTQLKHTLPTVSFFEDPEYDEKTYDNMTPTQESKRLADKVLAQFREAIPSNTEFELVPMTDLDYQAFGGVEPPDNGEALISVRGVNIDNNDVIILVGKNAVSVLISKPDDELNAAEYQLWTPFAQGKVIAQQVARCTTINELKALGFTKIN